MIMLCPLFVTGKMKQKVPNGARKVWNSKSQIDRGREKERDKANCESLVSLLYASFASYIYHHRIGQGGMRCMCSKYQRPCAHYILWAYTGPASQPTSRPVSAGSPDDHVRDRWHSFKAHLSQVRSLPSFVFYVFLFLCFYFTFSAFGNDISPSICDQLKQFSLSPRANWCQNVREDN